MSLRVTEMLERQLQIKGTLMGDRFESYEVMDFIRAGKIVPAITEIQMEDIPHYMNQFLQYQDSGKVVAFINGAL